ncbi:hypothetical protein E6H30_01710 [Candidatus Bathyarchaeota archaeon]|nr:MAG: hypothetical protein E6H30_01710 [Candidatus Bathyarchaeota archaeon]
MSYKNTSIPLRPGLNLIIGPNGAGKDRGYKARVACV